MMINNDIKRNYIFEACITIDGRYYVIHDQVFDIMEQKDLGNVWGSMDVFKTIFQNIKLNDVEYSDIRESIISLPLLENNENLYALRDILLEFNFWDDTWVGREMKSAGEGIKDFVTTSWEGLKEFGIAISKGEWSEILNLLAKGVRFVLRKLKDALYSNVGMVIDAILVATGIGKTVQWIPWALVLALDVYQIINDDWPPEEQNDPTWMKFLTLGFDILGLATAGVVAKGARAALSPLKNIAKNPKMVRNFLSKNPKLKSMLTSMINSANKVPGFLKRAQSFLSSKFPAGAKFINGILGKIGSVLQSFINSIKTLLSGTSKVLTKVTGGKTKTGTITRTGLGTGGLTYALSGDNNVSTIDQKNTQSFDNVINKYYGGKDPFD